MNVALIPARSGSKGVPDKNLLEFRGRSLIGWAARCAQAAGIFDDVLLSTDSAMYAEEGARYGCKIPYLRDKRLASDEATIADVILDLIANLDPANQWETLTILEPTCPLRTPEMVKQCYELCAVDMNIHTTLTVTEVPLKYHALKQLVIGANNEVRIAMREGQTIANRQELSSTYIRNGAAYVLRCAHFIQSKSIIAGLTRSIIISGPLVNIDTSADVLELRRFESGLSEWQ